MASRAERIEAFKEARIRDFRVKMLNYDQVVAVAVSAKLTNRGCTFDDEDTERRWVFNKYGDLIATRTKRLVLSYSRHPWQAGVRDVVLIA